MARILLIAHSISQGRTMADAIQNRSTEIAIVHSVEEAESLSKREPFGLIVLDATGEADAMASVRRIRQTANATAEKRIPLVVFAKSFSESSALLDSGEVDVLLEFPAHLEMIKQVVEQFVGC